MKTPAVESGGKRAVRAMASGPCGRNSYFHRPIRPAYDYMYVHSIILYEEIARRVSAACAEDWTRDLNFSTFSFKSCSMMSKRAPHSGCPQARLLDCLEAIGPRFKAGAEAVVTRNAKALPSQADSNLNFQTREVATLLAESSASRSEASAKTLACH